MNHDGPAQPNDFTRVSTFIQSVPEFVRQEYRDEIKAIVKELNSLLPRFRLQVDVNFYAFARQEVMRLTVYACDDSLDIYALEALRQHLEGHRRMFTAALADAPKAL